MFTQYARDQFDLYQRAVDFYKNNYKNLINIEYFIMKEICHFIDLYLPEIQRDYNEASYLYSFWKNYPPLDRGRSPKGDQYPWIEVGEQVFGNKLLRYFSANFRIKDSGIPSGSDDRCIISSPKIEQILNFTDSIWVFVDIKSAGPRDDFNHAVMSPNQISGSGNWNAIDIGLINNNIVAKGNRKAHNFSCSLSPIYVLSDGTVAPLITFVIKPVYKMIFYKGNNIGQPIHKIKIASIPNGILLTHQPNYLKKYPQLFFPGKDDKNKDTRKIRARVSFDILKQIDNWRVSEVEI